MGMRTRLILSFFLVVLVAVVAVVVFVRLDTSRQVQAFMLGGGMVSEGQLADELEQYHRQNDGWSGIHRYMRARLGDELPAGMGAMHGNIILTDPSGEILFDQARPLATLTGLRLSSARLANATQLTGENGEVIGYLLGSAQPMRRDQEQTLVGRLNAAAIRAGLVGLALALIVGTLLSAGLIIPIRSLTGAARRMASGDLNQQVPISGNDEVAELGMAFNTMSTSLLTSERRRKAMTAEIAHELRTPLAVQRAHLEALQDGIYPLTAENLQPIMDQTELLARLVEDLRTLALADAGELPLHIEAVDLPALLGEVSEYFSPAASAGGVLLQFTLASNVPTGFTIPADPFRLRQVLNNLIGNAMRYAPSGTTVELSLDTPPNQAVITVRDHGQGIAADALPHIFDRFFRSESARDRSSGGTGLGLAIARQLARAHSGDLTATNHPQGGALFTLTLPDK